MEAHDAVSDPGDNEALPMATPPLNGGGWAATPTFQMAQHECAHALAAIVLGGVVDHMTCTGTLRTLQAETWVDHIRRGAVSYAGIIANRVMSLDADLTSGTPFLLGTTPVHEHLTSVSEFINAPDGSDARNVIDECEYAIQYNAEEPLEELLDRCRALARDVVIPHWSKIEQFAERLLEHGCDLDAAQVIAIVDNLELEPHTT